MLSALSFHLPLIKNMMERIVPDTQEIRSDQYWDSGEPAGKASLFVRKAIK